MPQRPTTVLRKLGCLAGFILLCLAWIWAVGALHFAFHLPAVLALLLIPSFPLACILWRSRRRQIVGFLIGCVAVVLVAFLLTVRASNDRDWWVENSIQPTARFDDASGLVEIKGIRNFQWRGRKDFAPAWEDRSFQLANADSLDLIIEPLGDSEYFAHSMLSFGFGEDGHIIISVEVRREKGEEFGLLPGLYGQFELMYQVLDERDALTLRALDPKANLYIYPVAATPQFIRDLFVDMLEEANSLVGKPRFYHSLRSNCTTKLLDHMNQVIDRPLAYRKEVLFPSMAGKLLAEMDWLAGDLPYDQAKLQARSVDRVRKFAGDEKFSDKIRQHE